MIVPPLMQRPTARVWMARLTVGLSTSIMTFGLVTYLYVKVGEPTRFGDWGLLVAEVSVLVGIVGMALGQTLLESTFK